ncbi:uncharacterized protein LOC126372585 [Pectinophora gossypiella]|uniref:uncharacterized protein LOC126372585 n=1 Tax=Pectinophora gossypiella TaxID=13191 RepID=UPI00214EA815|nr:uncharacterized protein LOC126372585 [Pectinophora gossypiella]
MNMSCVRLFFFLNFYFFVEAIPVVLRGSSNNGDAVIAIASSDPEVEKYFAAKYPSDSNEDSRVIKNIPEDIFQRSFSFSSPGEAAAGTGRSFVSTSNLNPFSFPLFFMPLNLEEFGLNNPDVNWARNFEDLYNPGLLGEGVKSVTATAVSNNGHVYGKVKTVTVDDKGKSQSKTVNISN